MLSVSQDEEDGDPPEANRPEANGGRGPLAASLDDAGRREVYLEIATMGLYLAIVLLAELTVFPRDAEEGAVLGTLWGTSIGLALAHLFAFGLAARMVGSGEFEPATLLAFIGQLLAAVAVALVASIPFFFGSGDAAFTASSSLLALVIGGFALRLSRHAGARWPRAIAFAVVVLVLAAIVVAIKAALTH